MLSWSCLSWRRVRATKEEVDIQCWGRSKEKIQKEDEKEKRKKCSVPYMAKYFFFVPQACIPEAWRLLALFSSVAWFRPRLGVPKRKRLWLACPKVDGEPCFNLFQHERDLLREAHLQGRPLQGELKWPSVHRAGAERRASSLLRTLGLGIPQRGQ